MISLWHSALQIIVAVLKTNLRSDGNRINALALSCQVAPYFRSTRGENCHEICDETVHLNLDESCASAHWSPNYVEKDGCECLDAYKCCDKTCPVVNVKTCWGNGDKKGNDTMQW